jgi:ubiquinone/menaquinone biosynthesis C-methylase UbiE
MAATSISYPDRLLRDIGRIYQLPAYRSPEYNQIQTFIHQLFDATLHQTMKRDDIINVMQQLLNQFHRIPEKVGRADERVVTIDDLLKSQNFKPTSILDIGAGTGDITSALMRYYHLSPDRVFAIDQKLPATTDVTPLIYDNGKIPLPDNSIDLIILFAVLHHIPPEIRSGIMNEIYRVSSPNGFVIIREHDDDKDPNFFVYLDLYHILWYIAKDETSDPLYLLSRAETQQLFQQVNLASVGYHTYSSTIPNPKRMYHEIFKKISQPTFKFRDASVQIYLQTEYIQRFKNSPRSFDVFPSRLRSVLHQKYEASLNLNPDATWPLILKEFTLYLINTAVRYVVPDGGIYYLTKNAIDRAFHELQS